METGVFMGKGRMGNENHETPHKAQALDTIMDVNFLPGIPFLCGKPEGSPDHVDFININIFPLWKENLVRDGIREEGHWKKVIFYSNMSSGNAL